jgi:hypothetical protein
MPRAPIPNGLLTGVRRKNRLSIWSPRAMADVIYLVLGLAFFGLMALYAVACDRL